MRLTAYWNDERDICYMRLGTPIPTLSAQGMKQFPTPIFNDVLYLFYENGMKPYCWNIWDGDTLLGFAMSESMQDTDDRVMKVLCESIVTTNQAAPQTGDYAPKEIEI